MGEEEPLKRRRAFGVPCHGRAVEFRANLKSSYFKGFEVNRDRTTLVVLGTKVELCIITLNGKRTPTLSKCMMLAPD
jgi:hypothetical protein